jgi:NDP-sugar pyrophosphorylase family protein
MKILVPMAGRGSRFEEKGYTFPKPLIDVKGKPMIQTVIETLPFDDAKFIFVMQEEHADKWQIPDMLQSILKDRYEASVFVKGITEGAACTAMRS